MIDHREVFALVALTIKEMTRSFPLSEARRFIAEEFADSFKAAYTEDFEEKKFIHACGVTRDTPR